MTVRAFAGKVGSLRLLRLFEKWGIKTNPSAASLSRRRALPIRRLKGLLDIEGVETPVAVHHVQHIITGHCILPRGRTA